MNSSVASLSTLVTKGSKYFQANSTEAGANAEGQNSVAIGPNSVASGENSVAIGNGATALSANSVALGANSIANGSSLSNYTPFNPTGTAAGISPVGEVSVGAAGQERIITNVAAGSAPTDAVNVSQLSGLQHSLNQEIKGLKNGVAAAMAMQMPTLNIPGRVVLHTGVGNYDGATAFAVTGKYTAISNRWNLGAGVSVSGGKLGVSAGADFVMDWGHDYHNEYGTRYIYVPVQPVGGTLNTPLNPIPKK